MYGWTEESPGRVEGWRGTVGLAYLCSPFPLGVPH